MIAAIRGGVAETAVLCTVRKRLMRVSWKALPCFALLCLALGSQAQPMPAAKSQDPLDRDTPQGCVYAFLEACHSRNYSRACKYLDLRKLPVDKRIQAGPQLAQQLEEILDRDARFDVAALSRDPEGDREDGLAMNRERVDSFTVSGKTLELQLMRVTMHSGLSVWLFSSDTLALVPQLAVVLNGSA